MRRDLARELMDIIVADGVRYADVGRWVLKNLPMVLNAIEQGSKLQKMQIARGSE